MKACKPSFASFKIVTDANNISRAQTVVEERVQEAASRSGSLMLGYQGGGRECAAHFIGRYKFWVSFADSGNRYWNALGIGNPFKDSKTIIAEINPPKEGVNRRVSGAFVKDGEGKTYLVHRGKVGGGRKGIGKKAFMAWYQEPIYLVNDSGRQSEMIIIGALDDEKLIGNLAAFTYSVAAFKNEAVLGI